MNKQNNKETSTQSFIPIKEIKDGIVILKNGGIRTAVFIRGSNFELKSENEQNAIISSYQQFLNSLNFPIQIIVKSRKKNLAPYILSLRKHETKQENEALRSQTEDYIQFIERLMEISNIMTKEFYIVIPFSSGGLTPGKNQGGFFSALKGGVFTEANFEKNKVAILERTDNVVSGLSSIGLGAVQLNTRELIEFFYNFYNPELAQNEKLSDISQLISPYISGKPTKK